MKARVERPFSGYRVIMVLMIMVGILLIVVGMSEENPGPAIGGLGLFLTGTFGNLVVAIALQLEEIIVKLREDEEIDGCEEERAEEGDDEIS